MKYHVNPRGDANLCRVKTGVCPFGGSENHYDTLEEARESYEKTQKRGLFSKLSRKMKDSPSINIVKENFTVPTQEEKESQNRITRELADLPPGVELMTSDGEYWISDGSGMFSRKTGFLTTKTAAALALDHGDYTLL